MSPTAGLDTSAYVELANLVIAGDWGLGPGLYFVSPLYIYFVAFSLGLTKSFTAVRLLQAALGAAGVIAIWHTTREWFDTRAAWCAALLAAFTGLFTFYEVLLIQTSIDAFLTSAALMCLAFGLKRERLAWLVAAGLVFGIETLNRPNAALAAAAIILACAAARRVKPALVLTAGLALGMAPVAARNVVVSRSFTLVSTHGGLNFFIGNGPGATGFYHEVPGIAPTIKGQAQDARVQAAKALGHDVDDAQASNYYFGLALDEMARHPAHAAALLARKFLLNFHAQHVPLPYSYPFYQYDWPTWLRFYAIGPWLLVPLGLAGLFVAARRLRSRAFFIWLTFVPAYAASVALFFQSERYRLPLLVPLAIGAGAALSELIGIIRARVPAQRRADLAWLAAIVIVTGTAANTRASVDDGRDREGVRLAEQLIIAGRYNEAEAWVARVASTPARAAQFQGGIGLQYLVAGQAARAVPHLREAVRLNPASANAHYSLGQALLGAGDAAAAIPELRQGLALGATAPLAGYHLAQALRDTGDAAGARAALAGTAVDENVSADDLLAAGRLGAELNAPDDAERFFAAAVARAPTNVAARVQRGANLINMGRADAALADLTEAIRLDSTDAAALSRLALAEARTNRLSDARTHVQQALALDPREPLALQLAAALGR